ncbi:Clp protease N-terminal domain-containing protein [Streptomyces albipurpureus]|uniref:Clp protease N-terminal domain-containing protein n=1 Tax=Streptomyces albipurpureus TaxID=2897419 RepID=A0ABT0UXB3_9ACTN|nr:Clp protease N-terminal domain-containing protein [Streptomyces sp. CWNU-1]MCM2391811.1 Clp protease N-terminal domain-containing protein [Streptomyces sp. CWNU-1]
MSSHAGNSPTQHVLESNWPAVGVFGAAQGARDGDGPIGTEQLLAGLSGEGGKARTVLNDAWVTKTVILSLLRDREGRTDAWSSSDDRDQGVAASPVVGDHMGKNARLTGAARRAVEAAMAAARQERAKKLTPVHLLKAILQDDGNRAAETLRICGTTPEAVLALLDGAEPDLEDGLDLFLWPTRNSLLGLRSYAGLGLFRRWTTQFAGINWATDPIAWIKLESRYQMQAVGHGEGTEHLLLAVLATHEVAVRYAHLAAEGLEGVDILQTRYAGGQRLAEMGIGYVAARAVMDRDPDLGTADQRPLEAYLKAALTDGGTGPLVDALLRDDTRARRLVEALGAASD